MASETKTNCQKVMIEDCNITQMGRTKYRDYVTEACHTINEKWLREKVLGIECARISEEDYVKKKIYKRKKYCKRPLKGSFRSPQIYRKLLARPEMCQN